MTVDPSRPSPVARTAPSLAERAQRVLMTVVLALGAIDTAYFRQWNVNPDGVSYVDLARAFAAHGPRALVNGYWSPLYPAVLGSAFAIGHPTHTGAYPLMRGIGFVVFALTTFAFARLVRVALDSPEAPLHRTTRLLAVIAAWELYAVLVLKGIGLFLVTPDLGVAGIVFWAAAELIHIMRSPVPPLRWIRLGLVLGVGYWWKAILFPVSGVVLLVAAAIAVRRRDGWRGPLQSWAAFGALALLLVIPVSKHTGRLTFGETGRLNQFWYVADGGYVVDACQPPREPARARRTLQLDSVLVATPLTCTLTDRWPEATLPMWYDPTFYYRGLQVPLSVRATVAAAGRNIGYLKEALEETAPWVTVAFVLAGLVALGARSAAGRTWPLVVVAAAGTGFYLAVYVELRHVVPFFVIAGLAVLAALLSRATPWRRVALAVLTAGGAVDVAAHASEPLLIEASILRHEVRGDERPEQVSTRVARLLAKRGLAEGDHFAAVNTLWNVEWAQRGGYVVRAYTDEYIVSFTQTFRELRDPCARAAWERRLAAHSIDAALLRVPPGFRAPPGFEPLEDTGFHLLRVTHRAPPDGCPAA